MLFEHGAFTASDYRCNRADIDVAGAFVARQRLVKALSRLLRREDT